MKYKLWHDDIRRPPDDSWFWVRTNDEAKCILAYAGKQIMVISMDHDLGLHKHDPDLPDADLQIGHDEDDGKELVKWMVENDHMPTFITIHSWNPVGAKEMQAIFADAGHPATLRPYARPDHVG